MVSIVVEDHLMDICQFYGMEYNLPALKDPKVCRRINAFWNWAMEHEGEVEGSRRCENMRKLLREWKED